MTNIPEVDISMIMPGEKHEQDRAIADATKLAELMANFVNDVRDIMGGCDVVTSIHLDHDPNNRGRCRGYVVAGTVQNSSLAPYLAASYNHMVVAEQMGAVTEVEMQKFGEPANDSRQDMSEIFSEVEDEALARAKAKDMDPVLKH